MTVAYFEIPNKIVYLGNLEKKASKASLVQMVGKNEAGETDLYAWWAPDTRWGCKAACSGQIRREKRGRRWWCAIWIREKNQSVNKLSLQWRRDV